MKKCTFCNVEKEATKENFFVDQKGRGGLSSRCKECYKLAFYKKNCENAKKHYKNNREKKLQYIAEYTKEHSEAVKTYQAQYRNGHKEEARDYSKQYREINKDELARKKREYVSKNLDRFRRYRRMNKEHINARVREDFKKNKDKYRVYHHRRTSRKKQLENIFTVNMWNQCKDAFNHRCAYCGEHKKLSQDHFIALHRDGEYTINNIVPACQSCNSSKRDSDFFEWYPKQTYYSKSREQWILKYLNYKQENIQQLALTL